MGKQVKNSKRWRADTTRFQTNLRIIDDPIEVSMRQYLPQDFTSLEIDLLTRVLKQIIFCEAVLESE
jgi:hypothetical protein